MINKDMENVMKTSKELLQETRALLEEHVKFTDFEMKFSVGNSVFGESGTSAEAARILREIADIV